MARGEAKSPGRTTAWVSADPQAEYRVAKHGHGLTDEQAALAIARISRSIGRRKSTDQDCNCTTPPTGNGAPYLSTSASAQGLTDEGDRGQATTPGSTPPADRATGVSSGAFANRAGSEHSSTPGEYSTSYSPGIVFDPTESTL